MHDRVVDDGLVLASARGIGPVAFRDLLASAGGVAEALAALPMGVRDDAEERAADARRRARAVGAELLVQGEPPYPRALLDLTDPPVVLHLLGSAELLARPIVAVVGTRDASTYGERTAARLARELVQRGVVVASGMARGVDAAAHRGALDAGGGTIAVVAGGVDCPHPPRHRALHAEIAARGLVLAEAGCGAPPGRGAFPRRNRIIAALAAATIVIEAGGRSGALLTANLALDLGRPVGAVPGPIDSPASTGTNALIRDGAAPITGVLDCLVLAQIEGRQLPKREIAPDVTRTNGGVLGEVLWRRLRRSPASLDALVLETQQTPREVLRTLTTLEVAGLVHVEASLYAAT